MTASDQKKRRSISKKELTELYGISKNTLRSWLSKIQGIDLTRRVFTPREADLIFDHLGMP